MAKSNWNLLTKNRINSVHFISLLLVYIFLCHFLYEFNAFSYHKFIYYFFLFQNIWKWIKIGLITTCMNHVKGCKFKIETFLRGSGGWVVSKRKIVRRRTMTVKLKINIKNKSKNCFKIPKKKIFYETNIYMHLNCRVWNVK